MKNKLSILLVSLFVMSFAYVAVATEGFGLLAQDVNIENVNIENFVVNNPEQTSSQEGLGILGSSVTENLDESSTSTTPLSNQVSINIFDRFRTGDELGSQGSVYKTKYVGKASATSTIHSIQNNEGRRVYVNRNAVALHIEGAPAVSTNFCIGTSTTEFVDTANPFVDGVLTGYCGILDSSGGTWTNTNAATTTSLFAANNAGVQDQVWIDVDPGVYVVVYATSTDVLGGGSVTTSDSTLDTTLVLPYRFDE